MEIHVRTVTGLESVLAKELNELGARSIQPKNRLVIHGTLFDHQGRTPSMWKVIQE